jgi:hypothetical protein
LQGLRKTFSIRHRRRNGVAALVTAVVLSALAITSAAYATNYLQFGGPGSLAPNAAYTGPYDGGFSPYWTGIMMNWTGCQCFVNTVLIDTSGSWHCGGSSDVSPVACTLTSGYQFNKKPWCHNASSTYTLSNVNCYVDKQQY